MNTYTRKHLTVMVLALTVLLPLIVMGLLVGTFAFVAYSCDLPMSVSIYPWEFILACMGLTFAVGCMNACVEVAEYRDDQKAARERAARDAMWSDWDEALYACEVMAATRVPAGSPQCSECGYRNAHALDCSLYTEF